MDSQAPRCDAPQKMTREDYQNIILTAIKNQLGLANAMFFEPRVSVIDHRPHDIRSWVDECAAEIKKETQQAPLLVLSTGSMEAQIGIVLDQSVDFGDTGINSNETTPPWGIKESGFNKSNFLIWPFYLRQDALSNCSYQVRPLGPKETETVSQFNLRLVRESNLRVIILCEPETARTFATDSRVSFDFHGITYEAYIEFAANNIQLIYICFPEPLTHLWVNNWRRARKVSGLFEFTASITANPMIHAQFYSTAHACTRILRQYHNERNGEEKMILETIEPSIRAWLRRKGFQQDQDILRLEKAAGGLTSGMFMLMHVLPACPPNFKIKGSLSVPQSRERKQWGALDKDRLQTVTALYYDLNKPEISTSISEMSYTHSSRNTGTGRLKSLVSQNDSSDDLEETQWLSVFSDMADIDELNEIIEVSECDNVERSEISLKAGRGHTVTIRNCSLTRLTRASKAAAQAVPAHVLRTQMDLLNGRLYTGS